MQDPATTVPTRGEVAKLTKTPTFIPGFDDIAQGGLPDRRLIAIMGGPGSGKTVFALQTLVNRARLTGSGGIFVCFEEPPDSLRCNAASFAWDFGRFDGARIILLDGRLSPDAILSGDFDLSGLLAQIAASAEQIGASTVVFDGLDMLLTGLSDADVERRELLRISEWVHTHSLACIITGKHSMNGARELAREDYLHYITDMVIALDTQMYDSIFARYLRIIKYRGSDFSPCAFTAAIGDRGFFVVAKVKGRLNYPTFDERVSSGIGDIDTLVGGGYRRGNVILTSGAPGTAKTSLAGIFASRACHNGEKVVYISLDESDSQLIQDLRSIGVDLEQHRAAGRLVIAPLRVAGQSAARNYTSLIGLLDEHRPSCVVIDPLSALVHSQSPFASELCDDLLDETRSRGITVFCTSLAGLALADQELSVAKLSSVADTWLHLTYSNRNGERNRAITIVKSRGTAHSNQVRELVMSGDGIDVVDVYTAAGEVLMGTARVEKEQADRVQEIDLQARRVHQDFELTQSLAALNSQASAIQQLIAAKRHEIDMFARDSANRSEGLRTGAADRLRQREPGGDDDTGGKA